MIITLAIIIFIFIFFSIDIAKAQTFADSAVGIPPPSQNDSVSNYKPSLAVVIGVLSIMFSLTFFLLLYAKFCHRASSPLVGPGQIGDGLLRSGPAAPGLDKTVIESLPFFRFSCLKGSREGLECAVCLAQFEDIEILRLLPKCKHAFHIGCIDNWLEKHCTCPICRQKVSGEDVAELPYSSSLRFLWNETMEMREESNVELYVEREESRYRERSSRFSIGSSFRKVEKGPINEEESPLQNRGDSVTGNRGDSVLPLHKLNHKIVISDVVLKNRWSSVSSSDLMLLNSEMLNDESTARFSRNDRQQESIDETVRKDDEMIREIKQGLPTTSDDRERNRGFERKALNSEERRSMSEITVHPRFAELRNINVKEDVKRRIWLPIARKTVEWFANRETRPLLFEESKQTQNVV